MTELPDELLAAIHASPDDPAAYLVAADWLQQRGDPHGELIALAIALDREPSDPLALLVDDQQAALDPLGPLDCRRWSHDWRWGFLRRVVVSVDIPLLLRDLLRAPAAHCLRELVVQGDRASVHPTLELIIEHARLFGALRSLELPRWSIHPSVQPHWPELPQLERLVIGAAQLPPTSALPRLRELELELGEHDPEPWLRRAALPELETLVLHSAQPLADPARYLAPVPGLRRLTVVGHFGTVDERGLEALAARVEDVDVITYDHANTRAPSFRRFASRSPYVRGEPAALLSLGGSSPVEPGALYPLGDGLPFQVGRSTESELVVGPSCGRRHATIERPVDAERWTLVDLGATSTSVVCGTRTHGITLHSGDGVCFGTHVFRFLEGDVEAKTAALRRQLALPSRNARLQMRR